MKPIKCKLILHGSFKQHDGGTYESISAAKKSVKLFWNRPYTIKPIKTRNT